MQSEEKIYDWIVVGGGISGIAVTEILARNGVDVLLIEKNEQLGAETSGEFHEWFHSGALQTLVPDNLLTLRYLLGATDDLLEYYNSFPNMNLAGSETGVNVSGAGWFNNDSIRYKYHVSKANPVWTALVARSASIIDQIAGHDWLRRRAGSEFGGSNFSWRRWAPYYMSQLKEKSSFFELDSTDRTMNSRLLLGDLLASCINNKAEIRVATRFLNYVEERDHVSIETDKGRIYGQQIAICSPDAISSTFNVPIKHGFAPMAVVEGVWDKSSSFVELNYVQTRCINLLAKGGGIGQAGGITLAHKSKADEYLKYIVSEHKKRNPSLRVLGSYTGIKKELVSKGQDRNYLYHIDKRSQRVWSVVLGKFSLAFSMAPEFFRRIYRENPKKVAPEAPALGDHSLLSDTTWQQIVKN